MARKLPDPSERSEKEPAVLCDSARVLALYNAANKQKATRVAKGVREWFVRTAREEGWSEAVFINHVETRHSAGCVLYKRSGGTQVNVFISGDNDDDE